MESSMEEGFAPKKEHTARSTDNSVNRNRLITGIVAVVVVGAIGFVAGMFYQKGQGGTSLASNNGTSGFGQMGGTRRMGTFGTVSAVSDTSITVADQMSGTSATYAINSDTKITNDGDTASASDIKTGDTVMIQTGSTTSTDTTSGSTSSTDSKTATAISINPSRGAGPGGMGGQQSSSSSSSDSSTI
jgi:hypothetical protein